MKNKRTRDFFFCYDSVQTNLVISFSLFCLSMIIRSIAGHGMSSIVMPQLSEQSCRMRVVKM